MSFSSKNLTNAQWLEKINASRDMIIERDFHADWPDMQVANASLDAVTEGFDLDIKALQASAAFIFSGADKAEGATAESVDLLHDWHKGGKKPSMAALCVFAVRELSLDITPDYVQALLTAGLLGDIENDLEYHNNLHYQKVLFHVLRLTAVHNEIYAGTSRALSDIEICQLLIAACVHDLGHDGLGNTIKGTFVSGRLEKRSVELYQPYIEASGLTDAHALQSIETMILCTEVTPLGDPANPMNQMKAAYRFHFLGGKSQTHTLNLDSSIARLEDDPKLTMMSLLLHEADIATSAGLNYEITKYETSVYIREISQQDARPEHVINFLNQICQRKMLSDAAQKLYASNMARIYALAEEEMQAGNDPYPAPEKAEFIIAHKSGNAHGSKTIN